MICRLLALSTMAALAGTVAAQGNADSTDLTIYRSTGSALFQGGGSPIADGYAVIHEQRGITIARDGTATIDGLPSMLDAEAIAVDLGPRHAVLAQRVLAAGDAGVLAAHRGERVQVRGATGALLVDGVLVGIDGGSLLIQADNGQVQLLRDWGSIIFHDSSGRPGSTLQLLVEGASGAHTAALSYPTSGIGWRAAYSAVLTRPDCQIQLGALASIANRSGRDFPAAQIKLVAGEPAMGQMAQPVFMFRSVADESDAMPVQEAMGDYRSYSIARTLDLPDSSITQVPLYAPSTLDCQRSWVYESGSSWFPPKPQLSAGADGGAVGKVQSRLRFTANENLPAGSVRVIGGSGSAANEFLGENRIADTPKGQPIDLVLGNAFDLRVQRERSAFSIDRAARQLDESFRLTLHNNGEERRVVTVREHPNRWRNWSLASSSIKPELQKPDLLQFQVPVPAGGSTTLDYTIHYEWSANDE